MYRRKEGKKKVKIRANKGLILTLPLANYYKYKKRLLIRCIHHFKTDLIHKMDHMRISGTEPSSVILCQTK